MRGYFNWHVVIVGVTTMNINQALASLECQLRPCLHVAKAVLTVSLLASDRFR